jgi:hypothetical protein
MTYTYAEVARLLNDLADGIRLSARQTRNPDRKAAFGAASMYVRAAIPRRDTVRPVPLDAHDTSAGTTVVLGNVEKAGVRE